MWVGRWSPWNHQLPSGGKKTPPTRVWSPAGRTLETHAATAGVEAKIH